MQTGVEGISIAGGAKPDKNVRARDAIGELEPAAKLPRTPLRKADEIGTSIHPSKHGCQGVKERKMLSPQACLV